MAKLKRAVKPTKKKVIILILILIAVAIAVFFFRSKIFGGSSSVMSRSFTRTTTLAKTDLSETVSVTGTVESAALTNITSTANYKVKQILVQEGDSVSNGQVLAYLDTEDLDEQIADAEERLADNKKQLQKSYDSAIEKSAEALTSYNKAQADFNTASADFSPVKAKYDAAAASVAIQQANYDKWYQGLITAGNDLSVKEGLMQTALTNIIVYYQQVVYPNWQAENRGDEISQLVAAETSLAESGGAPTTTAGQAYKTAYDNYNAAKASYDDYNANFKTAESQLSDAKKSTDFDTIEKSYTTLKTSYENASTKLEQAESSYKTAQDSVTTAKENLDDIDTSSVEDLQKTLEKCTITSTSAGTITAVNATVGSYVSSGSAAGSSALFVIQDTGSLKISVTIDEYDVKTITTGMTAEITSDATGDEVITGHVSQISQTATNTNGTAGFSAEVTVDTADSGLLIGMNCTVDIIKSGKNDVYAVPYDAVGTDDNGNKVIYVKNSKGEFDPLQIATGEENDYYIEIISDELKDGMEVRSSADETSIDATEAAATDDTSFGFNMGGGQMGGTSSGRGNYSGGGAAPNGTRPSMGG